MINRVKQRLLVMFMILCFFGIRSADASGIRDAIRFIGDKQTVCYSMAVQIEKMPQYDSDRTEQLNRLMQHFSLRGYISKDEAVLKILLDGNELFSVSETENGNQRSVSFQNQGVLYSVPIGEEIITGESETSFLDAFSIMSENRDIYFILDQLTAFFSKLPELFPEQSGSVKINEKYKDYGTAVQKIKIRISAEELTDYTCDYLPEYLYEQFSLNPRGLVFSGRQDFELLLNEKGEILKIRYGGKAGFSAEDLRTVRLEWKTMRSEKMDKDELSLRTPNNEGTRRNNFILEHTRKENETGSESFIWKTEKDVLAEGIRTRKMTECTAETTGETVSGVLSESTASKGNGTGKEIQFIVSSSPIDHYSGTLEIISKKDKIEAGQIKVVFDFSKEIPDVVENNPLSATDVASETFAAAVRSLTEKMLAELMKLPAEDLEFLLQDIPAESLELILNE